MGATRRAVLRGAGGGALTLGIAGRTAFAQAQPKTLTITTTTIMTSINPYSHSAADLYRIWSDVYGTLGRYDFTVKGHVGTLAKSWTNVSPTRWRFTLRDDLKRHDGGPGPTSQDMIHTWQRIMTDPASRQRDGFAEVANFEAVDTLTFEVVTKRPYAQLLTNFFERVVLTSKDLYDQHGADADKVAPFGWGPYKLDSFVTDDRMAMSLSPYWPNSQGMAPRVVFRQMLEAEQRVTAVLTGEVQIARMLEPQLLDRVRDQPEITVVQTHLLETMFLATNVSFKPWDDVRVRRAMAMAIDRDLIIDRLLLGMADKMNGAMTVDQTCYVPPAHPIEYDPAQAKTLLADAGFANGVDIDFWTANGRYIADRQIGEIIAQMLQKVGFRVTLHAPDYATFFSMMQAGKLPLFYGGRSVGADPVEAWAQYFETGVSKRTDYSDPVLDKELATARATFDGEKECGVLQTISDRLTDQVPALYMWTHRAVHAIRAPVHWQPDPTAEVWLPDVHV
jgi:peptide/nickel transport system substrate-binding protein